MENTQQLTKIEDAIQNLSEISGIAPEVISTLISNNGMDALIEKYTGKILLIELNYLYVKNVEYVQNNIYKLTGTSVRVENFGDSYIVCLNENTFRLLPITAFSNNELVEVTKEEFIERINSQNLSFVNAEEVYNNLLTR